MSKPSPSPTDTPFPGVPLTAPLYREVKRQMMEALAGGEWKPGDAIPPERRLAERYGISIGTVRRAIDELVAENMLIRQQGRGTFVASHNRDHLLFYFSTSCRRTAPRRYPVVRLLAFAKKADKLAGETLQIAIGDPILSNPESAVALGQPVIVDDITVSARAFPGWLSAVPRPARHRVQPLSGCVRHLGRAHSGAPARDQRRPRDRGLLHVALRAPLLQIRRVALTYSDVPVELRISHVNTARHEYWSELKQA
jgi:GntR family transcriptional regulator